MCALEGPSVVASGMDTIAALIPWLILLQPLSLKINISISNKYNHSEYSRQGGRRLEKVILKTKKKKKLL